VASSDPELPSALFGDAAPKDTAAAVTDNAPDDIQEESTFGQQEAWNEKSFSTEDALQDDGFRDDASFSAS
jgi:hypothetical protein